MKDSVEKTIELKAPVSRVWHALTDYREFGEWFQAKLESPFTPGQVTTGHMTYPGYEHIKWEAEIKQMEPEKLFSYTWHPYAIDPSVDYSHETPTLVEFRLEKIETGTLFRVKETGFDKLPPHRREEALQMHEEGWAEQLENIQRFVTTEHRE
ncbi:SRPBCC family protein [Geomonas sp. Red32]|uniref:SRPBCC family protein n=1 Tax=Geomonas sp. Red32 TaxID=2912856 RepID=UPI00202CE4F7|nr:SRPBCC family protein [Geomonas sp. Red32]MCM0082275.1 SRPBCC family protein [Geomonas sp. Red32]